MKYEIITSKLFRRQLRRAIDRGYPQEEIERVIMILSIGDELDGRYKTHRLKGDCSGMLELHIRPDLLLLYVSQKKPPVIKLAALGTHAELFGK